MNRSRFPAIFPRLAPLVPLLAACSLDAHIIGFDDAGHTSGGDSGCAVTVCNEPLIPVGCTLGPSSCVDGRYVCPAVVCSMGTDAGSGPDAGCVADQVCSEPPIPLGCTLGPASCVDGMYVCPQVVCPTDAGVEDAGCVPEVCGEPPIPLGCMLGPSSCVDGHYVCPPVVCPGDAGADSGVTCVQTGCVLPPIPSDCMLGPASCVDGMYVCPQVVCPANDGSVVTPPDASTVPPGRFACGDQGTFCESGAQYCVIVQGGVAPIDGGSDVRSTTCKAIPMSCLAEGATSMTICTCIEKKGGGISFCSPDPAGNITADIDVP
jgi:hypothetical protein